VADLDSVRADSLASWNEAASSWGKRHDWLFEQTRPVTERLVARLGPAPGELILELAAGPGDLGLSIATRVEPGGTLISSDFAPEMVGLARENGTARGLTNVDYRVLDAERLDLADDSVDGVVCRWGFMLMADPGAALRETRRVLRHGGRLAFAVWAAPQRNPWMAVPIAAAVEQGFVEAPDPTRPGPFNLQDPEQIRALVGESGFAEPVIEEVAFAFEYVDFDEFWGVHMQLSQRLAGGVASLSEPERDEFRGVLLERLAPFQDEDGSYAMDASSWAVHVDR
jgi:ubiquinone/menaquinone biosynthesis C-methylase UbiE